MHFRQWKRREFVTLLGGAVVWPVAARAQQRVMPVIGFVGATSPDTNADRLREFRRGLRDEGFVERENVMTEYRWAASQFDRFPALAAELVGRKVDVIAVTHEAAGLAAKTATATIPIAFLSSDDPVRLGLVASLARPGGNVTGINFLSTELVAKRLELLRGLVPGATRIAVLVNPTDAPNAEAHVKDAEAAAHAMGVQIQVLRASNSREIDAAFATFEHKQPDALFIGANSLFSNRRIQLANLASRYRMPMTGGVREIAEAGALMSYGSNVGDAFGQLGVYIGRILKGTKPADLPVMQASKFELVINAQTARMLGLTVPDTLLAIADEVIE
jgi:putative ABC transport system substrate-binding protein